jgi:hypothetical protein
VDRARVARPLRRGCCERAMVRFGIGTSHHSLNTESFNRKEPP